MLNGGAAVVLLFIICKTGSAMAARLGLDLGRHTTVRQGVGGVPSLSCRCPMAGACAQGTSPRTSRGGGLCESSCHEQLYIRFEPRSAVYH